MAAALSNDVPGADAGEAQGDDDRLSGLPDHMLLCILERLQDDVRLLGRTCVLSKRWRTLPLMLPGLEIKATSFLPACPAGSTLPIRCLHQSMSRFTDALRFFLDAPAGVQRDMGSLALRFSLTKHRHRLHEIGRLVSAAVACGEVRELEVVLDTALDASSLGGARGEAVARGYARRFMRQFRAAPAALVGSALRRLELRNLCFRSASDLEAVLRACAALEALVLDNCWFAATSSSELIRVDAPPRSRLKELGVLGCYVDRVDVVQAPELSQITCENWFCHGCPVRFGPASAPSLKSMILIHRATPGQLSFKLSELLQNANPLEHLHLDFYTGRIWVQPENASDLAAAFSKLKWLRVKKMPAGTDISWTMLLIKAAPLLEFIDIHVCSVHVCCDDDDDDDQQDIGCDMPRHFEHRCLRQVVVRGGIDTDRDARFVRLVMERAVKLERLLLDARIWCDDCVAAKRQDPSASLVLSEFPEDKEAIDKLVTQFREGIPTSARIIVRSPCDQEFVYQ